jgi:citrate synthase
MSTASAVYSPGLEGVIAARTAISSVDGERGKLGIRGFDVEDLAPHATFEDMVFFLWHDELPDAEALSRFSAELAGSCHSIWHRFVHDCRRRAPRVYRRTHRFGRISGRPSRPGSGRRPRRKSDGLRGC